MWSFCACGAAKLARQLPHMVLHEKTAWLGRQEPKQASLFCFLSRSSSLQLLCGCWEHIKACGNVWVGCKAETSTYSTRFKQGMNPGTSVIAQLWSCNPSPKRESFLHLFNVFGHKNFCSYYFHKLLTNRVPPRTNVSLILGP